MSGGRAIHKTWNRMNRVRIENAKHERSMAKAAAVKGRIVGRIVGRIRAVAGVDAFVAVSKASAYSWSADAVGRPILSRGWWVFHGAQP